jgi:hypothetical protein
MMNEVGRAIGRVFVEEVLWEPRNLWGFIGAELTRINGRESYYSILSHIH